MIVAGIMSGTSLDGIDVAIVDIRGHHWNTLEFRSTPYPKAVRAAILAVSNSNTHTAEIARLHFLLGELYAEAVSKFPGVELVGCHGQTIFHESTPAKIAGRKVKSTLQIGEPSLIAEKLGVPVVSDFRPRDIAAGGTGAPLVPFVDYFLYRHSRRNRVALNIGGIGNITYIPACAKPGNVIAFDTGPGNMVIDALAGIITKGRQKYDKGARLASQGQVMWDRLETLMMDPFYRTQPPKSAGREQYGRDFVERLIRTGASPLDLIATATALTATSIAFGIRRFAGPVDEVIVSGGGCHNPLILNHLASFLPGVEIQTSKDYGIDPDAKEAVAFAILAYETWHRRPANLPSATGARHPVVLGKISY
jgi:anhydro-N-acetylmuramic acid kinase